MADFDNYIELNRQFQELSDHISNPKSDMVDMDDVFHIGQKLVWDDLVREYRAIILAEAGSGKTREIRQAAKKMREEGRSAFFLRLENIPKGLEDAFEEGNYAEFKAWIDSGEEGWIFLDSIDEARLKDVKDFEAAIKKVGKALEGCLERVHIIMTSRAPAWRAKTDLTLCTTYIPYTRPKEAPDRQVELKTKKEEEPDEFSDFDFDDDEEPSEPTDVKNSEEPKKSPFKFYTFRYLSEEQIRIFLESKGVADSKEFLRDVERQDAWSHTKRPQDLEELIAYWIENKRIGTRFELAQHSAERRLRERDQDRAEIQCLHNQLARDGARTLAAAVFMTNEPTIRIPDGSKGQKGLDVGILLPEWTDKDVKILLSRPLFIPAAHGTVRFHDRSVTEFLAAEWLAEKLKKGGSRRYVERLFFSRQYEVPVIVPNYRAVLCWLVLLDEKIRVRAHKLEPELFLEGGDPSRLPVEIRSELLQMICANIKKSPASSKADYSAVQRFANPDLYTVIASLIEKYKGVQDVESFLLRLIWKGRIQKAAHIAKSYAVSPKVEHYTRVAAIRAMSETAAYSDYRDVLESFAAGKGKANRDTFSELIKGLKPEPESLEWILRVVPRVRKLNDFNSDGLERSISAFLDSCHPNTQLKAIREFLRLIKLKPHKSDYCRVNLKYSWLMTPAAQVISGFIAKKSSTVLDSACLEFLGLIRDLKRYEPNRSYGIAFNFKKGVYEWKELNQALFWFQIDQANKRHLEEKGEILKTSWYYPLYDQYWSFLRDDFHDVINFIQANTSEHRKHVALSLAYALYHNTNDADWLGSLKGAVSGNAGLESALNSYLFPPPPTEAELSLQKQEREFKRRDKNLKKRREADEKKSKEWLSNNIERIRNTESLKPNHYLPAHWYLHNKLREKKNDAGWTAGRWQNLIPEYGAEVAEAYRDGIVKYWRRYEPPIRQKKDDNSYSLLVILGLSGLSIESREVANWPAGLSDQDVRLVCRYAFSELNGFPKWFQKLYRQFPSIVTETIMSEIEWYLTTDAVGEHKHYLIEKLGWNAKWLWNDISLPLYGLLNAEPINLQELAHIHKILNSSEKLSDGQIAALASKKCTSSIPRDNLPYWFAMWVGAEPEAAIDALAIKLSSLTKSEAMHFAMSFVISLVGDAREATFAREKFKTPQYLLRLYLLMVQYIDPEDDIDRSGKGAYSPGTRDNAQEARNKLFAYLREIPGKETFTNLLNLADTHPVPHYRDWSRMWAKQRLHNDAARTSLKEDQVAEYAKLLEFCPKNPEQLFDLAVQRLLDLKESLENSDDSNAQLLIDKEETQVRSYIGGHCRQCAFDKYSIAHEEEFADSKRPDLRFHGMGFDRPVPVELKLADNWTGPQLVERLENQLCRDYMRDERSTRGVFLLVYQDSKDKKWETHAGKKIATFSALVAYVQEYWASISQRFTEIDAIEVIGIDLTKRMGPKKKPIKVKKSALKA